MFVLNDQNQLEQLPKGMLAREETVQGTLEMFSTDGVCPSGLGLRTGNGKFFELPVSSSTRMPGVGKSVVLRGRGGRTIEVKCDDTHDTFVVELLN